MRAPGRVVGTGGLLIALLLVGCASPGTTGREEARDGPAGEAEPRDRPVTGRAGPRVRGEPDGADAPAAGQREEAEEERPAGGEAPEPVSPPSSVEPFGAPARLAEVLAAAEEALADPATPAEDHAAWAAVHQQAYRDLAAHPDWRPAARAVVPAELRGAFDRTLAASVALRELTSPREELPDWRIQAPPPADALRGHYEEAQAASGVPWHVLAAIHLIETRFGRIRGESHAGARGPMQFMPATWEAYGRGDVTDPRDAILAAGRYLAANGAPDDLRSALFAYNRSELYVDAVLAHAGAMAEHGHYLDVYHGWRVYYRTPDGDVVLEEGYGSQSPG